MKSNEVSKKNKEYIKRIFKNIESWNLSYVLEESKRRNFPILYVFTNIIESVNKALKYVLLSKKLCSNWLYVVKKIINYSNNKSKEINNITYVKKKD